MDRKRAHRVTQADIARHAGVSTAVVSLVLNDSADGAVRIAAATQQRVREAIQELGYVPNIAARQLARGRTNVIGVFTYEPIFPLDANNFYQRFLVGIEEAASQRDFNLLLLTGGLVNGRRSIYRDGANSLLAAEGALLLGSYEDKDEVRRLWNDGYPFVFVGRREIDGQNIPASAADYASASSHLMERFIRSGHRTIDLINSGTVNESNHDRLDGTRAASRSHPNITYNEFLLSSDEMTPTWLEARLRNGVTAIIHTNMQAALRTLESARAIGLSVPDDLSIASLGNADNPLMTDNDSITSFSIPHREMGARALELLADILSGKPDLTYPITIPCTFVPGTTLAPPPLMESSKRKGGPTKSVFE